MISLPPVRAILFDLDGTLVDTAPDIAAAVDATLRGMKRPALDEATVRSYVGRGVDVLLHRILTRERDGSASDAEHGLAREIFLAEYGASNGRTARIYPGVRDGIARARAFGFPLACVTNKLQTFSDALLAAVGLADAFEFVQGGDALPRGKPDPLPLTHAATRLGFAPPEVLMIGDSANDALAARRAGMPVVLVDYGYTEDQHVDAIDCDAVVSSIDDAIAALDPHRGSFDPASRADHLITSTKTGS